MSILLASASMLPHDESLVTSPSPHEAIAELSASARQLLQLDQPFVGPSTLHRVAACMHRIAAALEECEQAGLDRATMLPHLDELRALHARSPFAHRLQMWPRGYPGDFETVEWLCDGDNRAEANTVPWVIEQFALQSPVAQQHRNKVWLQAEAIRQALESNPQARIASIGCGGCRDLRLLLPELGRTAASFSLVDGDEAALAFAEARLGALTQRCTFVHGRVPRVLMRLRPQGPFDLVLAGGLFDYLPDRWAVETLRQVRPLLGPGARLLFSNMARGNPYRPWLVYLADWFLIERTDADISRLLEAAGFDVARVRITRDGTGLASLVSVVV